MNPSKHSLTVLAQIFKLIPRDLIPRLANEYGVSKKCRRFTATSHVLSWCVLELPGYLQHTALLWDSIRCIKDTGSAGAVLSAWILARLEVEIIEKGVSANHLILSVKCGLNRSFLAIVGW